MQWYIPIIPATEEAKIREDDSLRPSQAKEVSKTPSQQISQARPWWLTAIILAIWKPEIQRIRRMTV
jgi:hypothetical protein